MKGGKLLLCCVALFVLFATLATASSHCSVTMSSVTTQQFLSEIPSVHSQLQSCSVPLPSGTTLLVGSGNVVIDIAMSSGKTETVTVLVKGKQITGLQRGATACKQKVVVSESTADSILGSSNRGLAFLNAFSRKQVQVKGCTVVRRFFNFFTAPIARFGAGRAAPTLPPPRPPIILPSMTGERPDHCDETYLPGHRGYAENKAKWDSYSADSSGVCQFQIGHAPSGDCRYNVQLSISGNPYYLCWY